MKESKSKALKNKLTKKQQLADNEEAHRIESKMSEKEKDRLFQMLFNKKAK